LGSAGVDEGAEIEVILERAKGKYPGRNQDHLGQRATVHARDFKEFIRISGRPRAHLSVLSAANGKLKDGTNLSKQNAFGAAYAADRGRMRERLIQSYVERYKHGASAQRDRLCDGRQDMLAGRQAEIHAARDRKLEQARGSGNFVGSRNRPAVWRVGSGRYNDFAKGNRSGLCGTQPC